MLLELTDYNTVLSVLSEWLNCVTLEECHNSVSRNTKLNESLLNGICTTLRDSLVDLICTSLLVSVTNECYCEIRILLHPSSELLKLLALVCTDIVRVDCEEYIL